MSLRKELQELQAEKERRVTAVYVAYHHTVRGARRKLSPARMVRKHTGASLGMAAVIGYLLSPTPAGRRGSGEKRAWIKETILGWLPFGRKKAPATGAATPGDGATESAAAAPKVKSEIGRGLIAAAVGPVFAMLRQNKDIQGLVGGIVDKFTHRGGGAAPAARASGATWKVADAGTVTGDFSFGKS